MKGSSYSVTFRIRAVTIFAVAFVLGAVVIFIIAHLLGTALRVGDIPLKWRAIFAAAGLFTLALVDVLAIHKGRYCPLGPRRQTPKGLRGRYGITTVVGTWGFDTGLAITTFRVAAVTWGALVMTGLGLSSRWIGFGYGLGFVLPFLIIIFTQGGARSSAHTSFGSRMEGMLRKRAVIQCGSAVVLFTAGAVLLIRTFLRY